jgi:putative membrane protein
MLAYMGNYNWGYMLLCGLMMVLFWGAIIALVVFLVRGLTRGRGEIGDGVSQRRPTAFELLQERYARGEIDQQEYEQHKHDLVH